MGISFSFRKWELFRFSSVQPLSCVWLFATPWTAACQASLSITDCWSLLKLTSIKSVMPSNRWHATYRRRWCPYPPAFNPSQHQGLSQWDSSWSIGASASLDLTQSICQPLAWYFQLRFKEDYRPSMFLLFMTLLSSFWQGFGLVTAMRISHFNLMFDCWWFLSLISSFSLLPHNLVSWSSY